MNYTDSLHNYNLRPGRYGIPQNELNAGFALAYGNRFKLQPEKIFKWAQKHGYELGNTKVAMRILHSKNLLLLCVLNDWTFEQLDQELEK